MLTEETGTRVVRKPTEEEWEEFAELVRQMRHLNDGIDLVRDRLAFKSQVTDEERSRMFRDEMELERLIMKANLFMAKFG